MGIRVASSRPSSWRKVRLGSSTRTGLRTSSVTWVLARGLPRGGRRRFLPLFEGADSFERGVGQVEPLKPHSARPLRRKRMVRGSVALRKRMAAQRPG